MPPAKKPPPLEQQQGCMMLAVNKANDVAANRTCFADNDYDNDHEDDGDRSSSGKYYSIKSSNQFSSPPRSATAVAVGINVTESSTTSSSSSSTALSGGGGSGYPCILSTFGRHKAAATVAAISNNPSSNNPRIKTNPTTPTSALVLNANNLNNGGPVVVAKPAAVVINSSLSNSSSHSVASASSSCEASLTRSSNHYNEPDVYFTSSYCRLVPAGGDNNKDVMKSSSKVFPRTNPMYRNYAGGSTLKLNQSTDGAATGVDHGLVVVASPNDPSVVVAAANNFRPNDLIDACSRL